MEPIARLSSTRRPQSRPCQHCPPCPDGHASNGAAAKSVVSHPEQGWSLLCNGVVLFEDGGALLPSGQASFPPAPRPGPGVLSTAIAA